MMRIPWAISWAGAGRCVDGASLRGIFTERDVMLRGVLRERKPAETKVAEIMTTSVETTTDDTPYEEALNFMLERHIRHLPIVSSDSQLKGMLSIRNLLEHMVKDLQRELHSLDQYLLNDGPGG